MLTPEQYQAFNNAVDKFDKFIQKYPEVVEKAFEEHCKQFVDVSDIALGDKEPFVGYIQDSPMVVGNTLHELAGRFTRECHKCIYEVGRTGNPVGCKRYKRDVPDGGYYG